MVIQKKIHPIKKKKIFINPHLLIKFIKNNLLIKIIKSKNIPSIEHSSNINMLLEKVDLEKFGELSLKETKKFMP
jgi:hypothetical protein